MVERVEAASTPQTLHLGYARLIELFPSTSGFSSSLFPPGMQSILGSRSVVFGQTSVGLEEAPGSVPVTSAHHSAASNQSAVQWTVASGFLSMKNPPHRWQRERKTSDTRTVLVAFAAKWLQHFIVASFLPGFFLFYPTFQSQNVASPLWYHPERQEMLHLDSWWLIVI